MRQFLLPVLMALALLAGGILHGRWSDRWVPESKAQIAAAGTRITAFPINLGDWKGVNNDWPELNTENAVEKVLTRSYTNRLNGNSVGMLLACGNPRNLSLFHTPLECYPAQGYTLMASAKHSLRVGPSTVEFMVSDFKRAQGPLAAYVRVFWSWSGSGDWEVPEHPRLVFGRYRVLYKVYVARPLLNPEEPVGDEDPCVEFLRELLPEVERSVLRGE